MISLSPLYHWTPQANRKSILQSGLRVMNCSLDGQFSASYICLAPTPATAWGMLPVEPIHFEGDWDLWQVSLRDGDDVDIRGYGAPRILEVRVNHGLPADRIWWVGVRDYAAHCSLQQS